MPRWGCITDDLTGASDLATNFVDHGFRTELFFGVDVPTDQFEDIDVAVVALKSRAAAVDEAVEDSLAALKALRAAGCERFYLKYCSTFDSTPDGNIGPVIDAVLEDLDERLTIVVPSFPDAGRTVYRGHLFVGDEPLDESPMRHHPLTPMRDSSLLRLLGPQTTGEVDLITWPTVRAGVAALTDRLHQIGSRAEGRTCVVIDAIENRDLETIMEAASELRVVTGGSGLAQGLHGDAKNARAIAETPGRRGVLCGSASSRTREQIAAAQDTIPGEQLRLQALREDLQAEVERIATWADTLWAEDPGAIPMVFSVASLSDLDSEPGSNDLVERALAEIAVRFVRSGVRNLIVAGGETSGRVVAELGISALRTGPSIAPGVAWSSGTTADGTLLTLALKSGNFGAADMFSTAWSVLPGEDE